MAGNTKTTGKVKWFSDSKGYGFIVPEDGSEDVFVHYSWIDGPPRDYKTLEVDQLVEFDVVHDAGKPQARHVRILS